MEKKISKVERKMQKEKMSETVTGKMSVVFGFLVAALAILIYYGSRIPSLALLTGAQITTAVLAVAALVRVILALKSGKDTRFDIFSPIFTLGLAASGLYATVMYPYLDATYTILSLIAFGVLFFVYEVYSVDCFVCSAAIFSGIISAMLIDNANFGIVRDILVLIVYAAIIAACTLFTVKLVKNGKVKIGKKKIKKPQGMLSAAVAICIAVSVITVLGVLISGSLLYFAAAASAVYFIVAIIYTVRLM